MEAFIPIISAIIGAAGSAYSSHYNRMTQKDIQQRQQNFQLSLTAAQNAAAASNAGGSELPSWAPLAIVGGVGAVAITAALVLSRR